MDRPLGGIDLNRVEVDPSDDTELHVQAHDDTNGSDVIQQKGGEDTALNIGSTARTQAVEGKALEQPEKEFEEPEEGEISDDNEHETHKTEDILQSGEKEDATLQIQEPSLLVEKNAMPSFSRWPARSNGDGRQGGWKLHSEASAYSGQPDRFYQFAWAKGVQGSPKDAVGHTSQEGKSGRTVDNSVGSPLTLHRSGSADRKGGWIMGDRGMEYVSLMTSDDGYLYLQGGGDWSDQRRGESRRGRSDRESAERTSFSSKSDEKYRNQSDDRKDHRRRVESGRSSRDRRRGNWDEGNLEEAEMKGQKARMAGKGSGENGRHGKGRDWESRKSESSGSKGRDYNPLPESHKEKLFTEIAEYLRNVSVRDAQKSFLGMCRQLRRGLRALQDLNENLLRAQGKHIEIQQRKILALTRDAFSGIRAAYAVRNTAIGKEQEQNTDTFPRLLELARSRCYNLFTSKQIQELESMMQAVGCRNIMDTVPKPYKRGRASNKSGRQEEKDLRVGESSGNTSATTQLESESITDASGSGRTSHLGDEAEQPLTPSGQQHAHDVRVDQPVNGVDNSAAGTLGFGGWFSSNPEQDMKEARSILSPSLENSLDLNDDQSKYQPQGINVDSSRYTSGGNNKQDTLLLPKKELTRVSQLDPITALSSYHEKFSGKSQTASARLPSPTPSEEDDATANSVIVDSSSGANLDSKDGQPPMMDKQASGFPQGTQVSLFGSIMRPVTVASPILDQTTLAKDNHSSLRLSELSLFPNLEPSLVDVGSSVGLKSKAMASSGQKRSRDPRRRLSNQEQDVDVSQSGIEGSDSKPQWLHEGLMVLSRDLKSSRQQSPQTSQGSLLPNGELVPLLTLATGGGWPEVAADVPGDMDVGDADSRASWDSISLYDEGSHEKRQVDTLDKEASSKRRKFSATTFMEEDGVPLPKATAELQTTFVGAVSADIKRGVSDESSSLQGVTSSTQCASVSESTVHDVSKLRMKPRDPRRVLLEACKAISTAAIAPSGSRATDLGYSEAVGALPLPVQTHNVPDKQACSANLVTTRRNPMARTGSGFLQDSQSNGNNNKTDEPPRAIKSTGLEIKMPISKAMGTFDLNLSAAANLKNGEIMNHWDQLEPLLEGLDEKQKQAVRRERARRIEEQSRMFVAKKLCLVLDLDHTLLNSAKFTEMESEWEAKLQANELAERQKFGEEGSHRRELYRFQHMGMWTKLRPGIWNFLARASHLYELHVYTMGNKAYATEMAKLLDPTGKLFAGRVISKGDDGDIVEGDERLPKSKDLEGVLGMESAVVIIDDSARVWPHHRHNLIVVERYMYFPCTRKQFGLPGPSLLEVGHDEREQDGMLASALTVIEKIHFNFFSNPRLHEVDVRDILAKEQRRVLAGCKLIFSRVFPQGEVQPHLHPLWQLAEQFGAICSMTIDEGVTHVVAISLGTEKVNWAMSNGRFIVRPSWVEASAILYRRANERDFLVTL